MKYTKEARLDIGRRICISEITKYDASLQYGISINCARDCMRLYSACTSVEIRNEKSHSAHVRYQHFHVMLILQTDLTLPKQTHYTLNKYGGPRFDFLKKHRRGTYSMLVGVYSFAVIREILPNRTTWQRVVLYHFLHRKSPVNTCQMCDDETSLGGA